MFQFRHSVKLLILSLFISLSFFIVYAEVSSSSISWASKRFVEENFCKQNGDCSFNNLTVNNLNAVNTTVTKFNLTDCIYFSDGRVDCGGNRTGNLNYTGYMRINGRLGINTKPSYDLDVLGLTRLGATASTSSISATDDIFTTAGDLISADDLDVADDADIGGILIVQGDIVNYGNVQTGDEVTIVGTEPELNLMNTNDANREWTFAYQGSDLNLLYNAFPAWTFKGDYSTEFAQTGKGIKFMQVSASSPTPPIKFRDDELKIWSSIDGQLDIYADDKLWINASTVDIIGNLSVKNISATLYGQDDKRYNLSEINNTFNISWSEQRAIENFVRINGTSTTLNTTNTTITDSILYDDTIRFVSDRATGNILFSNKTAGLTGATGKLAGMGYTSSGFTFDNNVGFTRFNQQGSGAMEFNCVQGQLQYFATSGDIAFYNPTVPFAPRFATNLNITANLRLGHRETYSGYFYRWNYDWTIQNDDDGALYVLNESLDRVFEIQQSGNISLYSPDNTKWNCGVSNSGIFSCS